MISKATVREILDTIFDELADDITNEFNRRGLPQAKLMDVVRFVLRAYGNAVDAEAVAEYLKRKDPALELEAIGRNEEYGYIWARKAKGVRLASGLFGDDTFVKIKDPQQIYFVPGEVREPEDEQI